MKENEVNLLFRWLEKTIFNVSGKIIKINETFNGLAYTRKSKNKISQIFINAYSDYGKKCNNRLFIIGLAVHETLHQIFTDFDARYKYSNLAKSKPIFNEVSNILEDMAIENQAKCIFGGLLLDGLVYMVEKVFEYTPELGERPENSSVDEILTALCQVSNMGKTKGKFLYKNDKLIFEKILPIFFKGAFSSNGNDRMKYSMEISDIIVEETGIITCDNHNPMPVDTKSGKGKGKQSDIEEISDEEIKEIIEELATFEASNGIPEKLKLLILPDNTNIESLSERADIELSEALSDFEIKQKKEKATETNEYSVSNKIVQQTKCLGDDYKIKNCSGNFETDFEYKKIVKNHLSDIKRIKNSLFRMLEKDKEKKIYKQSGKFSMKRLTCAKRTTYICEKHTQKGDRCNLSVMLLVDHSGSMYGNKIKLAMETAVFLTEILTQLNIPVAVMGYNSIYDEIATHYNYINFESNPNLRKKSGLIQMKRNTDGANADGFSIRFAKEILDKQNNKHKIMFIIHDGLPSRYASLKEGITDTQKAILECRKLGIKVIGLGIDISEQKSIMDNIYSERGYIDVQNGNKMAENISQILKKELKRC